MLMLYFSYCSLIELEVEFLLWKLNIATYWNPSIYNPEYVNILDMIYNPQYVNILDMIFFSPMLSMFKWMLDIFFMNLNA